MSKSVYFIGVDVGTGSARAALISAEGKIIKVAVQPINTWTPKHDFYEQSSDNIWNSCVSCIKVRNKEIFLLSETLKSLL